MVKLLVDNGADINIRNKYGNTPLHIASINGNNKIIWYLKSHGADIKAKNNDGKTYLTVKPSYFDPKVFGYIMLSIFPVTNYCGISYWGGGYLNLADFSYIVCIPLSYTSLVY